MSLSAFLALLAALVALAIDLALWIIVRNRIRDRGYEAELVSSGRGVSFLVYNVNREGLMGLCFRPRPRPCARARSLARSLGKRQLAHRRSRRCAHFGNVYGGVWIVWTIRYRSDGWGKVLRRRDARDARGVLMGFLRRRRGGGDAG
jgi:hypothetical protein